MVYLILAFIGLAVGVQDWVVVLSFVCFGMKMVNAFIAFCKEMAKRGEE